MKDKLITSSHLSTDLEDLIRKPDATLEPGHISHSKATRDEAFAG
jgi:hypothetical protein